VADISEMDVLVRVLVAAGLGALAGLERERHTVAAGIRTHMLVAVGACLLTGTALLVIQDVGGDSQTDAIRIAAGIATGVGFIGAGTIIMTRGRVKGLTTAATIWVTAAVGITAGYGYLLLALLVAGPVTISILMLGYLEKWLVGGDPPWACPDEDGDDPAGEQAPRADAAGAHGAGPAAGARDGDDPVARTGPRPRRPGGGA